MHIAQYVRKYATSNARHNGPVKKDRINSTIKWVEYAADIAKMTQLLKTASFEEKYKLAEAMQIAERKKAWHYRQDNFDLKRASFLLQAFINAK